MALNREQKRQLRKRGEIDEEGSPTTSRRSRQAPRPPAPKEQRTSVRQYTKEVRAELRKVAWPTRAETLNYSLVVAVTLAVVTALVFGLDWVFTEAILRLFEVK